LSFCTRSSRLTSFKCIKGPATVTPAAAKVAAVTPKQPAVAATPASSLPKAAVATTPVAATPVAAGMKHFID